MFDEVEVNENVNDVIEEEEEKEEEDDTDDEKEEEEEEEEVDDDDDGREKEDEEGQGNGDDQNEVRENNQQSGHEHARNKNKPVGSELSVLDTEIQNSKRLMTLLDTQIQILRQVNCFNIYITWKRLNIFSQYFFYCCIIFVIF